MFKLLALVATASAFVAPQTAVRGVASKLHVDIPRISLPDQVADVLKDQGLKSPNDLSVEERAPASARRIASRRRNDAPRAPPPQRRAARAAAATRAAATHRRATSRENHDRYNSYSGAAIGGTLLLLVPIAYLDELLFAIVKDFAIAAILGGGAGAYLSLRSDSAGEAANKFGAGLLGLVDKVLD